MGKDALRLRPLFILFMVTTLNVQCARFHDAGGEDSGGGFVRSSTPASVNATIDLAIKLATEPNAQKNIFVQFSKFPDSKISSASTNRFFPETISDSNGRLNSPIFEAFTKNKIVRLEKGDCPQSIPGKHADASVSSLNLNATICFSIGNLTRLTPDVLLQKILALVIHEAAHLGGAQENEAVAWQDAFDSYFGRRFGEVPSKSFTGDTFKRLSVIRIHLARAQKLAADNPNNNRVLGLLGDIAEEVESLPYYNDALAIELKIKPPHPELIDSYSKSVSALAQKLQSRVEQYNSGGSIATVTPVTDDPVPEEAIVPLLNEVDQDLNTITENFLAVIGTSNEE